MVITFKFMSPLSKKQYTLMARIYVNKFPIVRIAISTWSLKEITDTI